MILAPTILYVVLASLPGGEVDIKNWPHSAEAHFMTREERREWELVKSADDAKRFITAFRARRDGDFVAEVHKRAALVDERLALGEAKASTTVRGKLAILLGAPAELKVRHIPKATVNVAHPTETRKGGATDGSPRPAVIGSGAGWVEYTFRYAANPDLGIGAEGWTITIEANAASGKDRLKYPRDRKKMEDILDAAARASFRNQ